jgi:hypothetical protein
VDFFPSTSGWTTTSSSNYRLVTSITFEFDSKLHSIDENVFAMNDMRATNVLVFIELFCKFCFWYCRLLPLITFESNLKLQWIDESAFSESDIAIIQISVSVEVMCKSCS